MQVKLRERNWLKTGLVMLALILLFIGCFSIMLNQTAQAASLSLETIYQRAFYETRELMRGVSSNLKKLLVAGSGAQEQSLLSEIARQTQGVEGNLSVLPIGQKSVMATLKYVNQTTDYCVTLEKNLAAGGALTLQDRTQLEALSVAATEFSQKLDQLISDYQAGDVLLAEYDFDLPETQTGDNTPASNYPVLLYDGPFSDGRGGGEMKALAGVAEVDEATARARLIAFAGGERVTEIALTGEGNVFTPCYEYSLVADGYRLSAEVTKAGGYVLTMLPEDGVEEIYVSEADCVARAEEMLISNGFANMQTSFYRRYQGILTINFAARQEGIILYPDLVKVQVSMRDGAIIGLEAANYYRNHAARAPQIPLLSEEQARAYVSEVLSVARASLCVIPLEVGEKLCYEMNAVSGDGERYLIYIDALTGREQMILQVLSTETGTLTQ